MTISAFFRTPAGAPLTGAATAPTYEIWKVGTGSVASGSLVEVGGGWYALSGEEALDGSEYVWTVDGDPAVAGQTAPLGRYAAGAYSGTERARIETDIPAILADTATLATLTTYVQESWTSLGLNVAAPASFDFPGAFVRALANATPIDVALTVSGTTVILTRQP